MMRCADSVDSAKVESLAAALQQQRPHHHWLVEHKAVGVQMG